MKRRKSFLRLLYFIFICTFLFLSQANQVSASPSKNSKVIDIMTTPEKVLFDIENFKPGDWAIRTITIKNTGSEDFNYLTSADRKAGSKKLYEELLLTISNKSGELYKGKLGEFNKIDPRSIASGKQEELNFTVEFPSHLGNEYQGLKTEVELKFYAEGTLGGALPVDGPKLPQTGTDTYNILIAGIALVLGGSILFFILKRKRLKTVR
ncbi:LPXTG cell wall anchor domain-containing protein [Bacillus timonensis]|uniref:LPXTG cell wall anchor domain-containing protein n=1 Tax=Bacillus timonensis TaxID=1033734 RepID=A0A4S3PZU2_9BACI|nr:LPXTG cell wall anchor domain-containing protein [Bacillus timonensis]THE15497.1 LPXTG cell wall anchor domain-containing protein [Bacillus timonensis]